MVNIKNDIFPYAEEKIIKNEKSTQTDLKTPTPIPDNFLTLTTEVGNYCGSTNPKWKDKLLCERYGFAVDGQWIQLDIPHDLMKELDLPLGEDIPHTVYISPQVLEKSPTFGGITINSKEEIFIAEPFHKEQETQTELTGEKLLAQIKEVQQESNLSQQTIVNFQKEVAELEKKLSDLEKLKEVWRNKWLKEKEENDNLTKEKKDYQIKQKKVEEELRQKTELIDNYLKKIRELGREKKQLNDDLRDKQNEVDEKDEKINQLNLRVKVLETSLKDYFGDKYEEHLRIDKYKKYLEIELKK
ncbi:Putative Virulent strain associated lipoprotein (fragment) [endosymbiont DhMRE of Dentiscutata heterogama]|uniref:hypothetical protein n=1 Tax=endosymbiont DhMRE of Dentiscutata heterogama TaxID=1609546 RepID=UPI000629D74B